MPIPIIKIGEKVEKFYSPYSGIAIAQDGEVNESDPSLLFTDFAGNGGYVSQRLIDHLGGIDHLFSLEPEELKALIDIVNLVPDMLGESFKITTRQEMETSYKFKKSLHARKRIEIGEVYSMENIAIKGPNGGISVDNLEIIIGRKATNVVEEDFPITWSAV